MNQINILNPFDTCEQAQAILAFADPDTGFPVRNHIPPRTRFFGAIHVDGICAFCGHWHVVYPLAGPAVCSTIRGRSAAV
jgi:hypothetical protein